MQAELSRSQFAQQTLGWFPASHSSVIYRCMGGLTSEEQSTAAVSSLSESYTSVDTLLASSRNLLGSLLRSQKSDTWYLETAFYIIVGTITWLLFRRIFYGPLWWLVWLPVRLIARFTLAVFGAAGITSKSVQSAASPTGSTAAQETAIPTLSRETGTYGTEAPTPGETESDRMIDRIGKMAEDGDEETNTQDISPEERKRQEEMPRNPKKRMFEAEVNKDEL
jgi:hypothetical protein